MTERSRVLAQLTDTLESVKSEMEERGGGAIKDNDDESLDGISEDVLGTWVRPVI